MNFKKVNKMKQISMIHKANKLIANYSDASTVSGEMIINNTPNISAGSILNTESNPLKYLIVSTKILAHRSKSLISDKKKRKIAIVIFLIWFILTIQNLYFSETIFTKFLNYIMFTTNLNASSIIGIISGVFSKGIIAFFISSTIVPTFKGVNPFRGFKGSVQSVKRIIHNLEIKKSTSILVGCGISLITYNFLSYNSSFDNGMICIVAFFLTFKSLGRGQGFVWGFFRSVINRYLNKFKSSTYIIEKVMFGCTIGFIISFLLSLFGSKYICYVFGALIIIVGLILYLLSSIETEVTN